MGPSQMLHQPVSPSLRLTPVDAGLMARATDAATETPWHDSVLHAGGAQQRARAAWSDSLCSDGSIAIRACCKRCQGSLCARLRTCKLVRQTSPVKRTCRRPSAVCLD